MCRGHPAGEVEFKTGIDDDEARGLGQEDGRSGRGRGEGRRAGGRGEALIMGDELECHSGDQVGSSDFGDDDAKTIAAQFFF